MEKDWISDLCVACGSCCMDVADAGLTEEDLARIRKARPDVPPQVLDSIAFRAEGGEMYFDSSRGRCAALDHTTPHYLCTVYENRPAVCRIYQCHVVADLKAWRLDRLDVPPNNLFVFIDSEEEARKFAFSSIPQLRSIAANRLWWHHYGAEEPAFKDKLIQVTGGSHFKAFESVD